MHIREAPGQLALHFAQNVPQSSLDGSDGAQTGIARPRITSCCTSSGKAARHPSGPHRKQRLEDSHDSPNRLGSRYRCRFANRAMFSVSVWTTIRSTWTVLSSPPDHRIGSDSSAVNKTVSRPVIFAADRISANEPLANLNYGVVFTLLINTGSDVTNALGRQGLPQDKGSAKPARATVHPRSNGPLRF